MGPRRVSSPEYHQHSKSLSFQFHFLKNAATGARRTGVGGGLNVSWLDTTPLSVCQVSLRLQAAPRSGESAACVCVGPRGRSSLASTRKLHFPCKPQAWGKDTGETDRGQQDPADLKA